MIGSSDGKQYETEFDLITSVPITPKNKEVAGDVIPYPQSENTHRILKETAPTEPLPNVPTAKILPFKKAEADIDRNHHVPLVASALTDKDGQMYGMAIDHRIPSKPEYEKHLWNHEAYENDYMNDLVKNGMSSKDAYHKAHDWSTARESAAVTAEFGEKGLEDYKQHWRDASSIAAEPTDKPRHPDAHTTKHGLDEAELGSSWQDKLMHLREAITGQKQPTKEELASGKVQIPSIQSALPQAVGMGMQAQGMAPALFGGVLARTAASAEKWFAGAEGKPRFEIPDTGSKLMTHNLDKVIEHEEKPNWTSVGTSTGVPKFAVPEDSTLTLRHILDHSELYDAYPQLKDVKIKPTPEKQARSGTRGGTSVDGKTIYLSPMSEWTMHSTLLHELQHSIQEIEGFNRGTNQSAMEPYVLRALDAKGIHKVRAGPLEQEAAWEAYRRTSGEVEARNVQFRHRYPESGKIFSPELTEDVPRDRQLNSPK